MLQLADRLTVPQVFFNEHHVGGADDTLAVLKQWQDEITQGSSGYKTLLERFQNEIEAQADPADPRLQVPTEPPVVEQEYKTHTITIDLPGTTNTATIREVTEALKKSLPIRDHKGTLKIFKQSFTGHELIQTLEKQYAITNKKEALEFARKLQYDYQIVSHVAGKAVGIDDTNKNYFRLQCHQTPLILNSYCVWKRPKNEGKEAVDATALLKHCKSLWSKVAKEVTDDQGRIDYKKAPTLEQYSVFEEAVCELQIVDWSTMDRNTKLVSAADLFLYSSCWMHHGERNVKVSQHNANECRYPN